MEQKKHHKQDQEQLPFSELLRQSIINQPYDLAALWGRAADSFPQNKRKQRFRTAIAVVVGVIIGAARTSAYYAVAPFIGVVLSMLILGERPNWIFFVALAIMLLGTHLASTKTEK